MQSEWQRGIDENPLYASSMGNLDKNDQWPEYSVEKIQTNYEHDLKILTQLNRLDSNSFSNDNLLNLQLFKDQYINLCLKVIKLQRLNSIELKDSRYVV